MWRKNPPTEMNCAKMNEATRPPSMLPRPPSTQMRNTIGPKERPIAGWMSYCSTSRHAPSPASAPPKIGRASCREREEAAVRGVSVDGLVAVGAVDVEHAVDEP